MSKHPGLVEEVNNMARGLPDKDKGDLYWKLFYQPVDGSGLKPCGEPAEKPIPPIKLALPVLSEDEITQTV